MHEFIIKKFMEKPEYYKYLKENSEWIKLLKRNPLRYKEFDKFVKKKYRRRTQDKLNDTLTRVNMLSEVLNSIK